jgi:subtilisin family serine protease
VKNVFRFSRTNSVQSKYESTFENASSLMKVRTEDYGGSYSQIHMLNGDFLHEAGNKGEGMLVAVIDDGFRTVDQLNVFSQLRNEHRILSTRDFVANESEVYNDGTHGMEVLSTLAGYSPGQLIGTAPNASFLLLRSEDDNTENIIEEYNWDAAAEYADSAGADVISSSLGYSDFQDTSTSHVYSDMDGTHCPSSISADIAYSKGMLVLTSAGNLGNSLWHYLVAPSDGIHVMCVGAVDSLGRHASFSSYGPAFGGAVKPNVVAQGVLSTLALENGGISRGNGTSFSCPILAGAATCLWQRYPQATVSEIKSAIERSASLYSTPNDALGYGIPDFRIAAYFLSTGIEQFDGNEFLGIYPNPFSEQLHIRFYAVSNSVYKAEMFNTLGKLTYSREFSLRGGVVNTLDINFDSIDKAGVYFLRFSGEGKSFNEIVVKD